jgi:sialic acid synthase SpsE
MAKIIAEICQNHNGNKKLLFDMLYAVKESGAQYAKIQTIFAEDLAKREEFENGLIDNGVTKIIKRPYAPEFERLKGLELDYKIQREFVDECRRIGLKPLTTCFSTASIPKIKELGLTEIKVASYDCGSLPMIKELAKHFDELIISTGATYNEEIEATAKYLKSINKKFSFLHCVTIYPTPLEQAHLKRMDYLRTFTPEVGFSDHTRVSTDGIKASLAALYCGADIIERHFTILASDQTKDGPVSINPVQLKELVDFSKLEKNDQLNWLNKNIPEWKIMLGSEQRDLSHEELLNRSYYRGRFASHRDGKTIYNWENL